MTAPDSRDVAAQALQRSGADAQEQNSSDVLPHIPQLDGSADWRPGKASAFTAGCVLSSLKGDSLTKKRLDTQADTAKPCRQPFSRRGSSPGHEAAELLYNSGSAEPTIPQLDGNGDEPKASATTGAAKESGVSQTGDKPEASGDLSSVPAAEATSSPQVHPHKTIASLCKQPGIDSKMSRLASCMV